MYQFALKDLDFTPEKDYHQLSNNTKHCQICKKASEPKKKKIQGISRNTAEAKIINNNNSINQNNNFLDTFNPSSNHLLALPHSSSAFTTTSSHHLLSKQTAPTLENADAENFLQNKSIISKFTTHRRLCTLLLFCALFSVVEGCGPGRGIGGPRRNRKLTPLVFKQHVPNMSERTLGASGLNEGAIKRDSPKFKNLVPNYNKDIIFKDDEGTGADRLMSRRCKEKLNILAMSVMNQWPGVRLRVTESWDEDNAHHTDSLHYEGRAVDITTSDRDRTKYGMLARLAVEAGFDWVYYESRAHIHCSVKSDSKHIPHISGCFSSDSSVLLANGKRKFLRDLNIGDRVLAMSSIGQPVYSEVILFMDRNLEQVENFVRIHTDKNNAAALTVTPAHLVLIWHPHERKLEYIFADRVQEDDYVFVHDHYGRLSPQRVSRLEVVRKMGVVAPLTREGTIVVDSVTASCYAVVNSQKLAHWGLAPMRLLAAIKSWLPGNIDSDRDNEIEDSSSTILSHVQRKPESNVVARNATTTESTALTDVPPSQIKGIHWYARFLYELKDIVLPHKWIYQ